MRRADRLGVAAEIGTRDDLLFDLAAAVAPGEPTRSLVVFRVEGFDAFTAQFGYGATDGLIGQVVACLPETTGPLSFYYRPREDELCALIAGRLDGIEEALFAAASAVYDTLGSSGVSLDFGMVFLPHEARDPVDALALANSRMTAAVDVDETDWIPMLEKDAVENDAAEQGATQTVPGLTRQGSA